MDIEEIRDLRAKVLNGQILTNEELNKLVMFKKEAPIIDPENVEEGRKIQKTYVKTNGKNLLPEENENKSQLGISNIIYLATISLVMEIGFLIVSLFIYTK